MIHGIGANRSVIHGINMKWGVTTVIDIVPNRDWKLGCLAPPHACGSCLEGKFVSMLIAVVSCFVSFIYTLADLQVFIKAIQRVITDEGFEIASEKAQRAVLIAKRLLMWINSNEKEATAFATTIIASLRQCCSHSRPVLCHTLKERMWENYFKYCSSDEFRSSWGQFIIKSIGFDGYPTFYQFVTKTIVQEIIKVQFPISTASNTLSAVASLDFEETNTLRYCGGTCCDH